jgi:hypothetical protein
MARALLTETMLQANWNVVRIVYGSGDPKVPMENRERTCLLHWTTSLRQHTQKYIKPNMQDQHNRLCKQYKDSMTMDETESRYLAIRACSLKSILFKNNPGNTIVERFFWGRLD